MLRQISRIQQNRLLAALTGVDCERLAPHLEQANLTEGQVLCEFGATPTHVYFPTTSILSLLHFTQAGDTSEIAVVGNEGLVGISLFTDSGLTSEHTTCWLTNASTLTLKI